MRRLCPLQILFILGLLCGEVFAIANSGVSSSDIELLRRQPERRTPGGVHIPLLRRQSQSKLHRRDGETGAIGLGDYLDVTYNVLLKIGGTETPLVLDTGSSDLWVISDACSACASDAAGVPLYPQASFMAAGLDVTLLYGDSSTGTHAIGPIGKDVVGLAGLALQDQYFAAVNSTNTSVLEVGSAGIFGLGFAINSVVWTQVFENNPSTASQKRGAGARQPLMRSLQNLVVRFFPKTFSFHRPSFPSLSSLSSHLPRQSASLVPQILASFTSIGPFLPRLVAQAALAAPMVTITLQRDAVDIGGNLGALSIGELPSGVKNESLTWTPVRGYSTEQGGLTAPADSPDEVYPIAWEIPLDDVYLDGEKLARSTMSPNVSLSALLDTGNSLLRGPSDVVHAILAKLGGDGKGNFPCSNAHTLAFEFGGKLFPVDPRDFIQQTNEGSVATCSPMLAVTDAPQVGSGYLYSWSLGDPFLKSVLASFYYGNTTYPSHDPPRIGLLSTVPANADAALAAAVAAASANGGNLPATSDSALSTTRKAASTNAQGVAQASISPSRAGSDTSGVASHAPSFHFGALLVALVTSFILSQ